VIEVSIIIPCLNERRTLGHCLAIAQRALAILTTRFEGEMTLSPRTP